MKKGVVKFYNETKGFGFINDNESKKDIFVHSSGLEENIFEGDQVSYDEINGKKGLNAINVKRSS